MTDPLLLPFAQASSACYVAGAAPTFKNAFDTCHCFQSTVNGVVTFAFEGSWDWEVWLTNFAAVPIITHPRFGPVHSGYLLTIIPVLDQIEAKLRSMGGPPFYLTGHSAGAGEAILAAAQLKYRGLRPEAVRAFEPPVVGSETLWTYLADCNLAWTQTRNDDGSDIVTLVPFGPPWCQAPNKVVLPVPDTLGVVEKHKIPAVLAAISAGTA